GGRLLYVGGIDRYKNLLPLAEAVARLRREDYPLTLHLVGRVLDSSTYRALERVARQADSGLFLHGEISHATIGTVYQLADAFVAPSGCETFGLVLPEAMGYGLPIAAAQRRALPAVRGEAAFFFEPDSVESIAAALRRLADDAPLRVALSQRARQRAKAFSWETCADETLTYLARIARHHQLRQLAAEPA
ncbi:MAG: glycosyltransferase, partial [Sphingobacteriaceae bacterium]|nr:glycosyltransferase [Cytophagaceae bacterium]